MAIWVSRPLWEPHLSINNHSELPFTTVRSISALDQALAQAKGQRVMVDFYADWCVSCIEFERKTLSQPAVQAALKDYQLIRVDVTANSADDAALLARYQLYGPPALIFYGKDGSELKQRVIGFQGPAEFTQSLQSLEK
jgi:thiol:disulfide interchange protein DsbD